MKEALCFKTLIFRAKKSQRGGNSKPIIHLFRPAPEMGPFHGDAMFRTFITTTAIGLITMPSSLAATVISVGDGDTIRVNDNGKTVTVRLGCIDSPERAQRPHGQMASVHLKQLLPKGQTVELRQINRDRYGRTVAEVFSNGRSVNLQLVSDGMAAVYRQYLKGCNAGQFNQAEQQAKQSGLGIWNPRNPLQSMPWDYRKRR